MLRTVHSLRVSPTFKLKSQPVIVSWLLAEDVKFLSQGSRTLLLMAKQRELHIHVGSYASQVPWGWHRACDECLHTHCYSVTGEDSELAEFNIFKGNRSKPAVSLRGDFTSSLKVTHCKT